MTLICSVRKERDMQYLRYPGAVAWFREQGIDLAEATLRRWVSRRLVPFLKIPGGKAVLFDPVRLEKFISERAIELRKASA
jgi:hypothetical protein